MPFVSRPLILLYSAACAGSAAFAQPAADAAQPVARFDFDAFDVIGNTVLSGDAIERAIYPYLGPGRMAADIEGARASLEKSYHDLGYQTVFVAIPEQSPEARIIILQVTEARIASIKVSGVPERQHRSIIASIPALSADTIPDLKAAERQITNANRIPERQIIPTVEPSEQPGTINVELTVTRKSPWHATLQLTNDHNDGTRPLRSMVSIRHSNLWSAGHQLTLSALGAPQNINNLEVYTGSYLAPVSSRFSMLLFGYKSNSNIAALGGTNVIGDGYQAGLRAIVSLPSSRPQLFHSINVGFDYKNFKEEIVLAGADATVLTPIDYVALSSTYQFGILTDWDAFNASIGLTAGVPGLGRESVDGIPIFGNKGGLFEADANFVHINLDADFTHTFHGDLSLVVRGSAQFATGPLISNEQFASGGMLSVRGYSQSEAVGDWGMNGSLELRTPSMGPSIASWIDEWRQFIFVDGAYIRVLDPGEGVTPKYKLLSAGLGTRIRLLRILSGEAAIGWPLVMTKLSKGPTLTFSIKAEY